MSEIEALLKQDGPTRAAALAEKLASKTGIKAEAARQRLARARPPIRKYPLFLLPKREGFFYLEEQRNTERYWSNLQRDLRATGSIYGLAIDAFMARGGIVPQDEFAVISGAPVALKRQIPTESVAKMLVDLGVIAVQDLAELGPCYVANEYAVAHPEPSSVIRTRSLVEGVILDGLREWVRKNGFASYDKIAIRGEDHPRMVGQFKWDLTGPSYLMPLRGPKSQNGFFVADVFSDIRMDAEAVRYFLRKAVLYRQTSRSGDILPLLMAESFTGEALTLCHKAGIIPGTPSNLFGNKVGAAIMALTATLKNAAGIAINNPEKLYTLLDSRDGFCARRFSLMIRLPEGRGWSRAKTLTPSQDSAIFLKLFEAEWAQFHHERHGYVLSIGVHLGDVIPLSERPGELFLPLAPGEPNKREKLAATIDRINRRFGQRVVSYGVHQDHPGFFEKG